MKAVNINNIITDAGTQSRVKISEETVSDYAEAMKDGAEFPPVTLFDDGVEYYLADGFHRFLATQRLGKTSIQANIKSGTLRDAVRHSLSANEDHGLRRNNDDKRKAVATLLDDVEWQTMSLSEMASECKVSRQLVSAVIAERETGRKVSAHVLNRPKKFKENIPDPIVNLQPIEKDEAVEELVAENQRLSDRLAVEAMDASEEEKLAASETIAELREKIRILEIENQSLKISRDTYQRENAEMKKTIAGLQRQLKKAA
jgi:uncharacterized ParB-like nuclease family protein